MSTDLSNPLDFSQEVVKQTFVKFPAGIGAEGKSYVLREASGLDVAEWRSVQFSGMTLGPDGKPTSMRSLAKGTYVLVGSCLFEEGSKTPVGLEFAKGLPHRILEPIYETLMRMSGLLVETAVANNPDPSKNDEVAKAAADEEDKSAQNF